MSGSAPKASGEMNSSQLRRRWMWHTLGCVTMNGRGSRKVSKIWSYFRAIQQRVEQRSFQMRTFQGARMVDLKICVRCICKEVVENHWVKEYDDFFSLAEEERKNHPFLAIEALRRWLIRG